MMDGWLGQWPSNHPADWLHGAWFREREAVGEVRYKQLLDLMMMLREEQAMRHRCVPQWD
jgi:hypothetical protein